MDFTSGNPQQNPNRAPRPGQPQGRRPVFDDFAPRPHAVRPTPQPKVNPQPVQTQHHQASPTPLKHHSPAPTLSSLDLEDTPEPPPHKPTEHREKEPKTRHETAHSGLVGFTVFVVLCVLALAPFLPGKIMQNFPGSSETTSTGEQTIGCAADLTGLKTSTTYDYKRGFPLVYGYQTTSTLQASCNGVTKSVTGGQTSQFNPLAGLADIAAAGLVAILVAKIWRKLFSPKY